MQLVLIHGANASADSFNYICQDAHLPQKKIFLNYKSTAGFIPNLSDMLDQLRGKKDLFIVAHSLGGIYALHLHKHLGNAIKGVVTLSTPYGGSKSADLMKYVLPKSRLLREIGPNADPIAEAQKVKITCNWTAVISTEGDIHMLPAELNDGVVTLDSMRARADVAQVETDTGHYEILVRPQTVDIIKQAIAEVSEVTA